MISPEEDKYYIHSFSHTHTRVPVSKVSRRASRCCHMLSPPLGSMIARLAQERKSAVRSLRDRTLHRLWMFVKFFNIHTRLKNTCKKLKKNSINPLVNQEGRHKVQVSSVLHLARKQRARCLGDTQHGASNIAESVNIAVHPVGDSSELCIYMYASICV